MPTTPTFGGFSFGRDVTVVLVHPNAPGGRVDLSNCTAFDAKPAYTTVTSTLLTGKTLEAHLPRNWSFSFDVDRGNPGLDTLQSGIDNGWYTSGIMQFGTMYQYVTEPSGAVTTFVYADVAIKITDAGRWEGDKKVMQKVEGSASGRKQI